MTRRTSISTYISRTTISLALLLLPTASAAQGFLKLERDTVPLFKGFAVSFDLVGLLQMQLSDYGQYEGALRLNLHDQYFPTFELGIGRANHPQDASTGIAYKTSAPYFRLGADFNIMKRKHTGNRIFVGFRYGYTHYKADISRPPFPDPVWKWNTTYGVSGMPCHQHWVEVLFGLDAKVAGPLHLGWSGRYRSRIAHDDGIVGNTWYVPGYGKQGGSNLGATFNVTIDI